jgi:hypothetical protein
MDIVQNTLNEVEIGAVDTTASLTDTLSFTKPKSRIEPPGVQMTKLNPVTTENVL